MVARVLEYKMKSDSIKSIKETLKAYNGSGSWAEKYSEVTLLYYEAFKKYNNTQECE